MGFFAVIIAALAGFGVGVGAAWYIALAEPWMRAAGIERGPDGGPANRPALPFVMAGIAMNLVAGMMPHAFALSGIDTAGKGLVSGIGIGIGLFFISPWIMMNNGYSERSFKLTLIDSGYAVLGCAAIGLVLGLF